MKTKKLLYGILVVATFAATGCKDAVLDQVTTLQTDRAFSPTGLAATVVNKTGVRLNWNAVVGAKNYTIEIYDNANYTGTPVKSVNNILFTQVPYTVEGLNGDTQYAIRVKSVSDNTTDSKWITASVKTDPEQIFTAVNQAEVFAKSVVLRWPAGQTATSIVLTPGNITYTVTAANIAAGAATVTGLTPETAYSAKLMNGTATRGTVTFTSGVDIGDAKLINNIAEFNAALATISGGETFALASGNYDFSGTAITIAKSISIVAVRASQRPVLLNTSFAMQAGAYLKLKNLILDGGDLSAATTANYLVNYSTAGTFGDLEIEGSIVRNFKAGIVGNTAGLAVVGATLVNNNVIYNFGTSGEFIDFRTGFPNKFTFTNNTLYNQSEREFIRMDAASGASYPASKVLINVSSNTLYGVGNYASSVRRLFYVRIPAANHEITFTKNIVANTTVLLANQAATNLVTVSGNNYFATANLLSSSASGAKVDATGTSLDPGFRAAATADFTVSQLDLKANAVGDPRWRQ